MMDLSKLREEMVEHQIAARGIRSKTVLGALRKVPREAFLPELCGNSPTRIRRFPLPPDRPSLSPILCADDGSAGFKGRRKGPRNRDGLRLRGGRAGRDCSGCLYVERIGELADKASSTLRASGYGNVHVVIRTGTLGGRRRHRMTRSLSRRAVPRFPKRSKEQLKVGGRLVIPVGTDPRAQELVRITADFAG